MAACSARALSFFALLLVGCSGAGNADLFNGDPGAPTSTEDDVSATEPTPSTKKQQPAAPGMLPGETPAPAPSDPGSGTPGTPADPVPTPAPAPSCTPAAEPNNDLGHAVAFTTSLCGKIDTASDVDYGTFVVPAGKTEISITHAEQDGSVIYLYYFQGIPLLLAGDGMKVLSGATYGVQIRRSPMSPSAQRPTYKLDISFK